MQKYLVAVSGGVDSVVLLDMLVSGKLKMQDGIWHFYSNSHLPIANSHFLVAHFDHGIRDDSESDARFVEALARRYGLQYVGGKADLGKNASEEQARTARYDFLFQQAEKLGAIVLTAHHRDDLIETIAINLSRGTGWRGLAVLDRVSVDRPLISLKKADIYDYAIKNHLEWVEDETNHTERYLRNRMRRTISQNLIAKAEDKLANLRDKQISVREQIDIEVSRLLGLYVSNGAMSRYELISIPETIAIELLDGYLRSQLGRSLVRPQLLRALLAIKTAAPGSTAEIGDRIKLKFEKRKFSLDVL